LAKTKQDPYLNRVLGDYRLDRLIAVGGMSRVYLGIDTRLERKAAVKILNLEQDWVDDTIIERFEREAKSIAALDHSNIVTIYQYGQLEDSYFLAMQYVEGNDLRAILQEHRSTGMYLSTRKSLEILEHVASALDYAHKNGIIHRDIKPSNILVTKDNYAYLTDFGLVLRSEDQTLGTAFGTPRYISPEQAIASSQATAQSDIYSLGVIIYEMLTGTPPFTADSPMEMALAHVNLHPDPPSVRREGLPTGVDRILLKSLSKKPEDRHENARSLVAELKQLYAYHEKISTGTYPVVRTESAVGIDTTNMPPPPKTPRPVFDKRYRSAPPFGLVMGGVLILLVIVIIGLASFIRPNGGDATPTDALAIGQEGSATVVAVMTTPDSPLPSPTEDVPDVATFTPIPPTLALPTSTPTSTPTLTPPSGVILHLIYDGVSLSVHNGWTGAIADTTPLYFARGERYQGGDDFSGDRILRDNLPPQACFRLRLDTVTPDIPVQCGYIYDEEYLLEPKLFFWRRTENDTFFTVNWNNNVVAECPTINEGESEVCEVILPEDLFPTS